MEVAFLSSFFRGGEKGGERMRQFLFRRLKMNSIIYEMYVEGREEGAMGSTSERRKK